MAMSFSAFGRDRGVSAQAVSKAVRSGRLRRSLGTDDRGRAVVADVDLARREWVQNAGKPVKQRSSSRIVVVDTPSHERLDCYFDGQSVVVAFLADVHDADNGWLDLALTREQARELAQLLGRKAALTESEID